LQTSCLIFTIIGIIGISIFSTSINAETVAKSTTFEKTTLLEFTNNDSSPLQTVKLWLGKESGNFKSFKAEKGWTGIKNPQGVIVFTSSQPLSNGESVKFGIKTEIQSPGVNWKTLDYSGSEISVGKVTSGINLSSDNTQNSQNIDGATFHIIPQAPKSGDTIRIVGDGFPRNTILNFQINGNSLEDFSTDQNGNVVGTVKIPLTMKEDRVDLALVDSQGNKKTISIRIDSSEEITAPLNIKKLTVDELTEIVEPGQKLSASGMGRPGSSVTITGKDPQGNKLNQIVIQVDSQGNWKFEVVIPLDAPLGTKNIEFSDGIETITKSTSVSVSKIIRANASQLKYMPGDNFVINGTAKSDKALQVIINDPLGKEIFSDILDVDQSGTFSFNYQTESTSTKGTYVVYLTQDQESEIVRIGLGELPGPQIIAKFDKLNYASSDTAKLIINGPAKSTISILIIDPSDKVKQTDSVTLGLDGMNKYDLPLSGYKSGVYTAVIKHPQSETNLVFSVGLQITSENILIQTTKPEYIPGASILLLGTSSPNTILNLEMSDPDGKIVKTKDIFSDKEGKFSEGTFRVPSDAKQGEWTVKAKSGPKFAETKFNVSGTSLKTFNIHTDKNSPYKIDDYITIIGTGGGKTQTAIITIIDSNNVKVVELKTSSTKEGNFQTVWIVPQNILPGKYSIKAELGADIAETTFEIQ